MVISTLCTNIAIYFSADKLFPEIKPIGRISSEDFTRLKKILVGAFLANVGSVLSVSFDNIVISAFLGIDILGYYSNYYYIITSIGGILIVIYTSMQAGIGNSIVLESREKNYNDLIKVNFGYGWIIGWCSVCLFFLLNPFIKLWIGDAGLLPQVITAIAVMNFYISNCSGILGTYKKAAGIWWEDRYRCLISGVFNLLLNVVLVIVLKCYSNMIALGGVLISTILSNVLINIPWTNYITFKFYFKNGSEKYNKQLFVGFFTTILNFCVCYPIIGMIDLYVHNDLYNLLVRAVILCILPNVLYYGFYHKTKEFIDFKLFLFKILKR